MEKINKVVLATVAGFICFGFILAGMAHLLIKENRELEEDLRQRAPELAAQWARDLRVQPRAVICRRITPDVAYCDVTVVSEWEGVAIHKLRCTRSEGCMLQR